MLITNETKASHPIAAQIPQFFWEEFFNGQWDTDAIWIPNKPFGQLTAADVALDPRYIILLLIQYPNVTISELRKAIEIWGKDSVHDVSPRSTLIRILCNLAILNREQQLLSLSTEETSLLNAVLASDGFKLKAHKALFQTMILSNNLVLMQHYLPLISTKAKDNGNQDFAEIITNTYKYMSDQIDLEKFMYVMKIIGIRNVIPCSACFIKTINRFPNEIETHVPRTEIIDQCMMIFRSFDTCYLKPAAVHALIILCHIDDENENLIECKDIVALHSLVIELMLVLNTKLQDSNGMDEVSMLINTFERLVKLDCYKIMLVNSGLIMQLTFQLDNTNFTSINRNKIIRILHKLTLPCDEVDVETIVDSFGGIENFTTFNQIYDKFHKFQFFAMNKLPPAIVKKIGFEFIGLHRGISAPQPDPSPPRGREDCLDAKINPSP